MLEKVHDLKKMFLCLLRGENELRIATREPLLENELKQKKTREKSISKDFSFE